LLLSFNESGEAEPLAGTAVWDQDRVTGSILRFKLNKHSQLLEARRDLWRRCREKIAECQNIMTQPVTVTRRERIKAKMNELRVLVEPQAVLSATARECLRKSNIDWASRIAGNN
jgi:dTDP-4-amino-4,6-dideoxygalactose transaminase